jgi:hypothetical protein
MATVAEITAGARTVLRDHPLYFEVDQGPLNVLTIRLPHPLIMSSSLQVYLTTAADPPVTTLTTEWQLDDRNGLLKLTNPADLGKRCLVAGYHYTWFSDADLGFYVSKVVNEMTYSGADFDNFLPAQRDVIMLGGVVNALWSLSMELALDIDVSTPEGMFIPARQRYQQVQQMLQFYERQYQDKASMLNMGLGALEVFKLRRVAYMTGRYVPVYQEREFDDPFPPDRLYPAIPEGVPPSPAGSDDVIEAITAGSVFYHQDSVEESEW